MAFFCHVRKCPSPLLGLSRLSTSLGGDARDSSHPLRFPSRSNDDQGYASDQGESTQNRRQGNPLFHCLSCLNRTQVHDLLLVRVREALVSQGN